MVVLVIVIVIVVVIMLVIVRAIVRLMISNCIGGLALVDSHGVACLA